jgi:hypothetical protein
LPAQPDQYDADEVIELRWGRIVAAVALVLVLAYAFWFLLQTYLWPPEMQVRLVQDAPRPQTSQAGAAQPVEPEQAALAQQLLVQQVNELPAPSAIPAPESLVPAPAAAPVIDVNPPQPVVRLLDPHIVAGRLEAIGTDYDQGHLIEIGPEGIIRVELHTQMNALQGQMLQHLWLHNGEPVARVKIPVNVQNQSSYSSKFINRQMTGDWEARVVDAEGRLLAQATFSVR